MKDSLFLLVQKLLSNNRISFNKSELSFQIQSHPSYPSLHAITGVLDHFNIENLAADVPVTSDTLAQLPESFLAQINTENQKSLVIVEKNKKTTDNLVLTSNAKKETITKTSFLERFTGILVAVEKEENEKIKIAGINEVLLYGVLITSLITVLFYQKPLLSSIAHILLSIIGVLISLVILKQENGEETTIGNAFCSGNIEKRDCDAVLASKGAKLFKNYKLSDLSFVYFLGLILTSLLLMTDFYPVHYISFIAIPITLYSIYYQYAIVKKWCLLCLTIVGVLWLQFILSFYVVDSFNLIAIYSIAMVVFSFATVNSIWFYLKPILMQQKKLKKDKIAYVKFKRNYVLFDSLLQKSKRLDTSINNSQEIIFGNPSANLEILIITNPFCGHCKPVHTIIEDILKRYGTDVKIVIRFNIHIDDNTASNEIKVTSKLIELFNTESTEVCMQAMHEIYGNYETVQWFQKWGITQNMETSLTVLKTEKEWCINNAINFTPEILINGQNYPKEYEKQELLFFIEDLVENCFPKPVFNH